MTRKALTKYINDWLNVNYSGYTLQSSNIIATRASQTDLEAGAAKYICLCTKINTIFPLKIHIYEGLREFKLIGDIIIKKSRFEWYDMYSSS